MPSAPIPFAPNQQSGFDAMNASITLAVNVIIDKSGAVRRRPGVSAYEGAPTTAVDADGIDGMHVTNDGKVYVAGGNVGARSLYRVVGGAAVNLSGVSQGELVGSLRPVFAETEALVAIAAGGAPQKILLADDTSSRLGGSPPSCSHVVANASRLLANNVDTNLNRMSFSDLASGTATAGHETWTGGDSGFVTAEGRPDPVVALGENMNEVFLFGTTSLQIFAPDATNVYSPVSTREVGCIAPQAIVKYEGNFYWMDQRRRIIQSDGRSVEVLSDAIQATLDDLERVDDAYAMVLYEGICNAVIFVFPSDGRAFAYQIGGGWAEWMGWSNSSGNFDQLGMRVIATHPLTGKALVGMADGRVGVIDLHAHTDLGDPIPVRITTGELDRGSTAVKHCTAVRLSFRRGSSGSSTEPIAYLSWRDDEGEWGPGIEIGLGGQGDRGAVVSLRSLGTYRRRQWRIDFDGDSDFVLAGATEEYDVVEEG